MVKDLYLFNSDKKLLKIINTSTSKDITIYDDKYTSELDTGAETYTASAKIPFEMQELFIEGNYIGFYWQGKFKMMQIKRTESVEKIDDIDITIYAEFIGIELYNCYVSNLVLDGTATTCLANLLIDTNYKVGYISPVLDEESFRYEITDTTSIYTVLQDLIPVFHYAELEFCCEILDSIKGKYSFTINIYANGERGDKRYKRFEANRNSYGMKRTGDITNFCSGIIPIGPNGLTITEGHWEAEHGAPLDKPSGQNFLFDPEAHAKLNNGGKYILMKYKSDANDVYSLMWDGYYKLMELNQTKFSYEVPVYLTEEEYSEIGIGDTNYVINDKFNPPIQLEARISKFEISFTDRSQNKITLSNFKEVRSKIKSLNSADIINETLEILKGKTGPLTQADILILQKYLADLDIQDATIETIMKKLQESLDDKVEIGNDPNLPPEEEEEYVEDKENYKTIKIDKIDNGLFLGDKRIYDIKNYGVANITVESKDSTPTPDSNSKIAQEYKAALEYYEKFNLGKNKNNSGLASIMSDSNKYKIGTIVRYWCSKFGLDTRLIYAMIMGESSGNPYCSGAAYGLMQCEKSCYYGIKQTIKFVDGTTKIFTPSDSTMNPSKGKTITINGVKVNGNISNQIMFGCHEFRKCAESYHFNVFASLIAYNMGPGGINWCCCEYIKDKYGYTVNSNTRSLSKQSTKVRTKFYEIMDTYQAPFASYRKKYKAKWGGGTVTNIEYYLRYYKPYKGSLPYFKDKKGNKIGYGVIVPSESIEENEDTGSEKRDEICKLAIKIVEQHTKQKIATYCQNPRTVDFTKPKKYYGTKSGIKNPIVYDCSSLASCCYLNVGLSSIYNKSCAAGTLVSSATSKSGYKMWKCDSDGIEDAIPGDLIMGTNYTVTSSNCKPSNWTGYKRTHHVMVYLGKTNGVPMIAHASGYPMTWPQALRIDTLKSRSDYKNNKMFFLRPWDLAAADKVTNKKENSTSSVIKTTTVSEVTIKGADGAYASDYMNLPNSVTINGITDSVKFPTSVPYVYCHFGVGDLDTTSYKNLLNALLKKYPKKPIFVAKEYHVNSSYSDATNVNAQIDAFNATMENFCNQTKYVIFLDIGNDLVDSDGAILSSLSSDGYSFKDKASTKKYYDNVKKYIFNIAKGQILDSTATTVTLTAQSQKIHRYTKPVKSFTLKLPTTAEDNYYTRLIFITDSSSIKFVQPSTLYMSGDNCKNGAFTPAKANRYIINIFKNTDTELTTKKYYGSVTSEYSTKVVRQEGTVKCNSALNVRKGAGTSYKILGTLKNGTKVTIISKTSNNWYKIKYSSSYGYVSGKYITNVTDVTDKTTNYTNYANFKYRDKLVANAESFYSKRTNFVYNNTCAFDYSNPSENVDKWMTDGKYHIDDNFLMQMLVMGYSYDTANLKNQTSRKKVSDVSWALPYISSESKLVRYFVEQGWILDDVDYDNYSNIEPGDIIFYDADDVLNNEFMGCSHTAICVGKTDGENYIIEGHSTDGVIRKVKMSTRGSSNLLCVGRINLSK